MNESILPLSLDRVTFTVGEECLLKDVSACFEAGGPSVIIGPNGSGKSLTLRIAHGLLQPTSGSVKWAGCAKAPDRSRQAMVFEKPVLLRRSALANVEYGLSLAGVARPERRDRALSALARSGIRALSDRPARVLSSGEQQRLALARAWALDPEVLFLDEPTAALDPSATRAIEDVILKVVQAGTKVIMTSHDMGQARRLADEIILLDRGSLVEKTPAREFFDQPQTETAVQFMKGTLTW